MDELARPSLARDLRLISAAVPTCPLNVAVPWPVDQRLMRLVQLISSDGLGPTSKRELAAALVQTAPPTALEAWDRVLAYRRATVGDAAFWVPSDVETITFDARRPGRPAR